MKILPLVALVAALPLALAPLPGETATDQTLPGDVSASLLLATTPRDIAELVLNSPDFAGTIIRRAGDLGIANSDEVVRSLVGPSTSTALLRRLVFSASEAAPEQADTVAASAFRALGEEARREKAGVIAASAIAGVDAAIEDKAFVAEMAVRINSALQALVISFDIREDDQDQQQQARTIPDDSSGPPFLEFDFISEAQDNPSPN